MATKKKAVVNPAAKRPIDRTKKNGFIEKTEVFTFNGKEYEMTDQQRLFCMEYVRNKFNASEAALAAGYSPKNAGVSGCALLKIPKLKDFIRALQNDLATVIGVSAADIAMEYARIGFSDVREIFDADGNLLLPKDFSDKAAANVSSFEIVELFEGQGPNRVRIGAAKKVRLHDKVAALDKLARMLGVDGVTKVAQTDTQGNEVMKPTGEFAFKQVQPKEPEEE